MNRMVERFTSVRIEPDRLRLLAGGAAIALVAGFGGLMIGRSSDPAPAAAEEAEEEHAEGEGREGFVALAPAQVEANGIAVERVTSGSLEDEILAQATVTAPPEGQAVVTARADGAVVRMTRRLGDAVGAGETIALLESREAAAFVAERNAAAARAQAARSAAAREQRLFDAKITARQDLEAAVAARRTAEADLQRAEAAVTAAGVTDGGRHLAARSPIGGRISEVNTRLGAYVTAGAELFHVADPRRVQIEAAVPVADAQRIVPGDKASVELPNGSVVDATVRSATPALNAESRAATVVLQLGGAPGGLTQGQAVRVRIVPRGSRSAGIVVPEEAVQQIEGKDSVFVAVEGGFQAVPVATGGRSGGRIEIVSGLRAGQSVVTRGAFVLKSQLGASEAEH